MIRINLLKGRTPGADPAQAVLHRGGAATFISRREAILGAVLLLLGVAILGTQVFDVFGDSESFDEMPFERAHKETAVALPAPRIPTPDEAAGQENGSEAPPNDTASVAAAVAVDPEPVATETIAGATAGGAAPATGGSVVAEGAPETGTAPPEAGRPRGGQGSDEAKPSPNRSAVEARLAAEAAARAAAEQAARDAAEPLVASTTVTGVQLVPYGEALELFIEVAGSPAFSSFELSSPNRLVLDVPGAALSIPNSERERSVEHALLDRIRIAQNSINPPKVRIVVEVGSFPKTETTATERGISIRLSPKP